VKERNFSLPDGAQTGMPGRPVGSHAYAPRKIDVGMLIPHFASGTGRHGFNMPVMAELHDEVGRKAARLNQSIWSRNALDLLRGARLKLNRAA